MTFTLALDFVTETCCRKECSVTFAFTRAYYNQVRNDSSLWWHCPNGHSQHYTGESDATKLQRAKVREEALQDQLSAAIRDAEDSRVALLRDRQRFANGVCPCCNRSFENVRQHMTTKHPEYRATEVAKKPTYRCSCGTRFDTFKGLRIHQGRSRRKGWDRPKASAWAAHLTEVGATR